MEKNNRFIWILSLFIIALAGCDYFSVYSYILKNNTQFPLTVNVSRLYGNDTTVLCEPDSEKIIFVKHSLTVAFDREDKDTLLNVQKLEVLKNDTIHSVTDFRKRDEWLFEKLPQSIQQKSTTPISDHTNTFPIKEKA